MSSATPKLRALDGGRGRAAAQVAHTSPPSDLEAEEYLLSCCLLDANELVPLCLAARFVPGTFYDTRHGLIFGAITALYGAQKPVAIDTVVLALTQSGELERIGGYSFLTQVTRRIPTTAQARVFLDRVRACWIRRQIIDRADRLKESALLEVTVDEPLAEWLSPHVTWFENALSRLASNGRGDYTLARRIQEVRADVTLRAAGQEDRTGWIWTGFSAFDDLARGACLRPLGSMDEDHNVLIGGGSSHGKSVLMRQLAGQALIGGQRTLVYTLETSVKGFIRALAANWSGVNLLALARTPRDLLKKFDDACAELEELADKRLFVYQHEPGTNLDTIEGIATHARRWSMQHGAPHLMVTDYLQLLKTKKRCNSREQEVAEVSHTHQALTRELGCVSLGGAQLNENGLREMRTVRKDENGKVIHRLPNRGDLRESQSLYHDCDVCIFLYQPPVDCRGADQSDGNAKRPETWLVVDKRRNGLRGFMKAWFEKSYLRFRELSPEDYSAADTTAAAATGTLAPGQKVSKRDYRREGGHA